MGSNTSPFRTWNGVDPHRQFDGVWLHAVGGEQVLLCRVRYEAGKEVVRHSHPEAEQVIAITAGEVTVISQGETRTMRAGDVAVFNRNVEHELVAGDEGVEFFEALAPVPLDHVPDRERDLVLGPDGGSGHVER
ncbi:MAG TPA: cupin domain-containing protein [Gaiellaceae bacterium]|nr:cupin domain-containing protein [Gaiellaceae bacterium]